MRHTAIGSTFFALAAFAGALLSSPAAQAQQCSGCVNENPPVVNNTNPCLTSTSTYTPARFTSGAPGDVSVNAMTTANIGQQLVAAVVSQLGGATAANAYVHDKILFDASGQNFTQTFPIAAPPSSLATGEPNTCSLPLSPFYLARLGPGANTYYEDAVPGVLVKAMGTAGCKVPADGYHLSSVLQDAIPGGSCEKELVDYCGVPVQYNTYPTAGDRTFYTSTEGYNALNHMFSTVYAVCMDTMASSWPPWGIGCGGTSSQTACQRASWQVVNEVLWPAYPIQYWGLEGCNSKNCGYAQGWSDFNVLGPPPNPAGPFPPPNYNNWTGTMLGAGKQNGQLYLTPSAAAPTNAPLVPGACDDGGCNNAPINWTGAPSEPAWAPNNFTANIPQNIINAATRLKKTQVTVAAGSGITAGYTTITKVYHNGAGCKDSGGGTGTCQNGTCEACAAGSEDCD